MKRNNSHLDKFFERSANVPTVFLGAMTWSGFGTRVFQFSGSDDQNIPWLNNLKPDGGGGFNPQGPRRNRNVVSTGIVIGLIICIIGGIFAMALYRAQNMTNPTEEWTSVAAGETKVSCQELIDRAMQASGDSCDQMGTNQVCYGNNTLLADLIAGTASRFSQRGDMVSVTDLRKLAASPLSLTSEEWGIAVFKVMANLPRSLPGETISMIVFGNTTLDNASNNLQTFYFSSTLGQIVCDQVPFDGLMITMPDGSGVSFVINGAEMTLMGNASITATQNGSMEVSLFSGSATITSSGQTQIVTAGHSTSMDLGGDNGTSAISPPSAPEPLSPEELTLACTLTGNFCSQQEITPVSPLDAVATLISILGLDTSTNNSDGAATSAIVASPTSLLVLQGTDAGLPSSQSQQTATLNPASTNTIPLILTNTFPPSFTNTLPLAATNTPLPPTNTSPPPTNTSPPPPTATNPPPPPPTAIPKIAICHCTSSDKTGCNEITINNDGTSGHLNHPFDIIPAPAKGCP
jgi:hypothetical protein